MILLVVSEGTRVVRPRRERHGVVRCEEGASMNEGMKKVLEGWEIVNSEDACKKMSCYEVILPFIVLVNRGLDAGHTAVAAAHCSQGQGADSYGNP